MFETWQLQVGTFWGNESLTEASDAFLMLTCIGNAFERYNNGSWPFGRYGCKLFTYFSFVFMYASRFSVVLLAFDRFIAVSAPLKTVKYRTQKYAKTLCTILWSVCVLTSVYTLFLRDERPTCHKLNCLWVLDPEYLA